MKQEYDGWTVKNIYFNFLLQRYFHPTKEECIKDFEKTMGDKWRGYRRRGQFLFKLVKVRLVEVE